MRIRTAPAYRKFSLGTITGTTTGAQTGHDVSDLDNVACTVYFGAGASATVVFEISMNGTDYYAGPGTSSFTGTATYVPGVRCKLIRANVTAHSGSGTLTCYGGGVNADEV